MSDIKVGDLVMIVKPAPCCGRDDRVGLIFTVTDITTGIERCCYCESPHNGTTAWRDSRRGAQIWRLKRIPPLDELDEVISEQEITA